MLGNFSFIESTPHSSIIYKLSCCKVLICLNLLSKFSIRSLSLGPSTTRIFFAFFNLSISLYSPTRFSMTNFFAPFSNGFRNPVDLSDSFTKIISLSLTCSTNFSLWVITNN